MNKIDLRSVLMKWLAEYGKETTSKSGGQYQSIHFTKRVGLYTILIQQLKDLGAVKHYFTPSNKDFIIYETTSKASRYYPQTKVNIEIDSARKNLDIVIEKVYLGENPVGDAKEHIRQEIKEEVQLPTIQEKSTKKIHDQSKYADIDEPEVSRVTDPEWEAFIGKDKK